MIIGKMLRDYQIRQRNFSIVDRRKQRSLDDSLRFGWSKKRWLNVELLLKIVGRNDGFLMGKQWNYTYSANCVLPFEEQKSLTLLRIL